MRTNTRNPAEIEKGPDQKTEAAQPTRAHQKDQDHGLETEKGLGHVTGKRVNQDLHPDLEIITEVVEDLEVDRKTVNDPDLGIEPEEPVTVAADQDQETDIQDQKDLDHVTKDLGHVTGSGSRLTKHGENQILQIHPPPRLHPDLEILL